MRWVLQHQTTITRMKRNITETAGTCAPSGEWENFTGLIWSALDCAKPASKRRCANVVLMLAHRLRRWTNMKTTLTQRLLVAGKSSAGPVIHVYHVYPMMDRHIFTAASLDTARPSGCDLRSSGPWRCFDSVGGGPRVVVSTAAFHARVRGSVPGPGGLKETKNVSSPSTCESQYCGEPPWPRGSVLGFRISNPVSGGQCHLNHLTILRRFSL